jgi:hypothetical protein
MGLEIGGTGGTDSTRETWGIAMRYITERKRIEEALGFMVATNDMLRSTADPSQAVQKLRDYAVPFLADLLGVRVGENGEWRFLALDELERVPGKCAELFQTLNCHAVESQAVNGVGANGSTYSLISLPIAFRGRRLGQLWLARRNDALLKYGDGQLAIARELAANLGWAFATPGLPSDR